MRMRSYDVRLVRPIPRLARELLVMGGDSAKEQMRCLQDGVDIVCGTPGHLNDLITTGRLDFSGVRRKQHQCSHYYNLCFLFCLTDQLLYPG